MIYKHISYIVYIFHDPRIMVNGELALTEISDRLHKQLPSDPKVLSAGAEIKPLLQKLVDLTVIVSFIC